MKASECFLVSGGFEYLQANLSVTVVGQIGKTKIFLRAGQMASLDAKRTEVLSNAARTIQMQIRTFIARKEFVALRKAAIHVQSFTRGTFLDSLRNTACSVEFLFGLFRILKMFFSNSIARNGNVSS